MCYNCFMIGIYEIKSNISGNRYVGSSVDIKHRWYQHKWQLKRGEHHSFILQRAWDKYGEKEFSFNILLLCEAFELERYEQYYLDKDEVSYNVNPYARPGRMERADEWRKNQSTSISKWWEENPYEKEESTVSLSEDVINEFRRLFGLKPI